MKMGRGEELGSGVLNVNKYLPLYAKGAKPQFVEGNPFVSVIPLPAETREKTREKILRLIQDRPGITTEEISSVIAVSPKGIADYGDDRRYGSDPAPSVPVLWRHFLKRAIGSAPFPWIRPRRANGRKGWIRKSAILPTQALCVLQWRVLNQLSTWRLCAAYCQSAPCPMRKVRTNQRGWNNECS